MHPTTGALYAIGGLVGDNPKGMLYVINTVSGAATFLGDTGKFFASIAFAPDGTLYLSSGVRGNAGPFRPHFYCLTLDPKNAAFLTRVASSDFYHSLAVRPTDGVIFGGTAIRRGCSRSTRRPVSAHRSA